MGHHGKQHFIEWSKEVEGARCGDRTITHWDTMVVRIVLVGVGRLKRPDKGV